MGVILKFPATFFLKVVTSTPQSAELVLGVIKEVGKMGKPWYGFNLAPGARPVSYGCAVVAKVTNRKGDEEGLKANYKVMRLRRHLVLSEDPSPKAGTKGQVKLIA